ncbi:MAG TPA: helix-turn-helix domain-containing protein [Candidatus Paceibacterota bacterium]
MDEILQSIGLSPDEITVYEYLLTNGARPAGDVSRQTSIKRGTAYNVLSDLVARGFARQVEGENKVMRFALEHPSKIKEILEGQKVKQDEAARSFETALPSLTSRWNLVYHRPAVTYYEGLEGVKRVLEDSLNATDTIYSYADLEAIARYIPDVNKRYVTKREEKQLKKRGIVIDTSFAREFLKDYHPGITETKLIKTTPIPFSSVMQIYNDKVSYITLNEGQMMGVIIEDAKIAAMHRSMFEYLWEITPEFVAEKKELLN